MRLTAARYGARGRDPACSSSTVRHRIRYSRKGRNPGNIQLRLPFDKVRCEYSDAMLPPAPVAGGSNATISVAAVVQAACDKAKKIMHGLVSEDEASLLIDTWFDEVEFRTQSSVCTRS